MLAVKPDIHAGIFKKPFVALHSKIYYPKLYVLLYPSHKALYSSFNKISVKCFAELSLSSGIPSEGLSITVLRLLFARIFPVNY